MRCKAYWNLHKKLWSVVGPSGRVILHTATCALEDVRFVVRPGGKKKVRETGRKNVHAFVVGTFVPGLPERGFALSGVRVAYNPKHPDNRNFYIKDSPWLPDVTSAKSAGLHPGAVVFAVDPRGAQTP